MESAIKTKSSTKINIKPKIKLLRANEVPASSSSTPIRKMRILVDQYQTMSDMDIELIKDSYRLMCENYTPYSIYIRSLAEIRSKAKTYMGHDIAEDGSTVDEADKKWAIQFGNREVIAVNTFSNISKIVLNIALRQFLELDEMEGINQLIEQMSKKDVRTITIDYPTSYMKIDKDISKDILVPSKERDLLSIIMAAVSTSTNAYKGAKIFRDSRSKIRDTMSKYMINTSMCARVTVGKGEHIISHAIYRNVSSLPVNTLNLILDAFSVKFGYDTATFRARVYDEIINVKSSIKRISITTHRIDMVEEEEPEEYDH